MRNVFGALALALPLLACARFGYAADDPDAKGMVSVGTPTVQGSTIKVTAGTRSASAGWTLAPGVGLVAIKQGGGRVWDGVTAVQILDKSKWTGDIPNVPNGTYDVWAVQVATNNTNPQDVQNIGSKLGSATVNATPGVADPGDGGSVSFGTGQPVRQTAQISGSGPYTVNQGWRRANGDPYVHLWTIPVDGGLIRELPGSTANLVWSAGPIYVPSTLNLHFP